VPREIIAAFVFTSHPSHHQREGRNEEGEQNVKKEEKEDREPKYPPGTSQQVQFYPPTMYVVNAAQ
jgi:hypothetical protein